MDVCRRKKLEKNYDISVLSILYGRSSRKLVENVPGLYEKTIPNTMNFNYPTLKYDIL